MTLEQIIGVLGQFATWITVLVVFLTLREMEKQRKASQKPELIVPSVSIFGYANGRNEIFIASNWSNKKIIDEGYTIGRHLPTLSVYNIGLVLRKKSRLSGILICKIL